MAALSPAPWMGNYFLHYTSREGSQNIASAGWLRPGAGGKVYLTKEVYTFGADAANCLSIINKPVELAVLVDPDRVQDLDGPFPVEPIRDDEGRLIRVGRGTQFYTSIPIVIQPDKERWLGLLEP